MAALAAVQVAVLPHIYPAAVLRRAVRADILALRAVCDAHPEFDDHFSTITGRWLEGFSRDLDLRPAEYEAVLREHITMLQNLAVNAFGDGGIPLDLSPQLGSDGHVYSKEFLQVHIATTPAPFNHRSPLHPNDEVLRFTVKEHPIAAACVMWLQRQGALAEHAALKAECRALEARGELPFLPTEENVRIREMVLREEARRREVERAAEAEVAALHARRDAAIAAIRARFAAVAAHGGAGAAAFAARADRVDEGQEAHAAHMRAVIERMGGRIAELEGQDGALRGEIAALHGDLDRVRAETVVLRQDINKTKQLIEKANKNNAESSLGALAVIAVCTVVRCAMGDYMSVGQANPGVFIGKSIPF